MRFNINLFSKLLSGNTLRMLLSLLAVSGALQAFAVTDGEMNQARAIAAKYYIRYVNNASGYLDDFNPSSLQDLEGKLSNDKDRESFRQFKNISPAGDYSSWDKTKLAEYWSTTFFSTNGSKLDPKGANNGQAKVRIKNAITAMKVAAPAAAAPQEPAPAPEPEEPAVQETPDAATPYDPLADAVVEEKMEETAGEIEAQQDSLAADEAALQPEKKSSGTWVYVMVLCILVAVVIALVTYASRTMRRQPSRGADVPAPDRREARVPTVAVPEPVAPAGGETNRSSLMEETRMREKYAETLASKAEEIHILTRRLSDAEMLNSQLKEENRRLKEEIEGLRRNREETDLLRESRQDPRRDVEAEVYQSPRSKSHEVFLGRVNARGIFVRADRKEVEGQSVYRLRTSNGISGTFTVVNNPATEEQLIEDPAKWLAGGCFAKDLYDTDGCSRIYTETPGTAVFKDGAWRVERKAKISYD